MLRVRLNYYSLHSIENDDTKNLYYEEVIEEYVAKNVGKTI